MKKKLGIGILALIMISGALAFANNSFGTKSKGVCPDRPGCICSDNTKQSCSVKTPTCDKTSCPDGPGCN
jgi:hypothetical protein